MTGHSEVLDFLSQMQTPTGPRAGEPLEVFPWQTRFIRDFLAADGEAALTLPRGAGKSTFLAALLIAYFIGPLLRCRTDLAVIAPSLAQTGHVLRAVKIIMRSTIEAKRDRFRDLDSTNRQLLEDRVKNIRLFGVGSEPRRLHGAGFRITLVDELAQFPPRQVDPMISAIRTSSGKVEGSRILWIGTRPADSEHPFARMLDGRDENITTRVVYSAREKDPPFQARTRLRANPSLRFMPALMKAYRKEAKAAKSNRELVPAFEALRLNKGVPDHAESMAALLTPEVYQDLEVDDVSISGDYVLGLDVGGGHAQTAAAAVTLDRPFRVEGLAAWPGIPELKVRTRGENLSRYRRMVEAGELLLQEGRRVVDLGEFLQACFSRWGRPYAIVADRYRQGELLDVLETYGFGEAMVTWRGMGYLDGSEDVRRFQKIVTDQAVTVKRSLLLRTAFAVARLVSDPAGNSKIAKQTERGGVGKDDAAVAVVIGLAEADRLVESGPVAGPTMHFVGVEEFEGWNI